jgi:hypothetical protein
MPTLDADSIDAIVSDPPYGLSFMGKAWDHGVPGEAFWREALRVAKPGAHLLAFGGTRTYHRLAVAIEDAGWEVRDCLSWLYGSGFPKSHNLKDDWQGWGTALKPAWEPIIVARKPLVGTVAANVTQYGTGAINVDGCRIGTDAGWSYPNGRGGSGWHGRESLSTNLDEPIQSTAGRWPANVLLDEDAAAMLGEPSRFFYCAKASRSEREAGLEGMPTVTSQSGMGGAMPVDDNGNERDRFKVIAANHHPTVKPIDVMRWLVRLVTPPNGVVLDPFCGSGSTGCAAVLEGKRFVGIEREPEYAEIARRRIDYWAANHQPELW